MGQILVGLWLFLHEEFLNQKKNNSFFAQLEFQKIGTFT